MPQILIKFKSSLDSLLSKFFLFLFLFLKYLGTKQCATGNPVPVPVPVPVDPVYFSDPVPVRFRPNNDRIDRI